MWFSRHYGWKSTFPNFTYLELQLPWACFVISLRIHPVRTDVNFHIDNAVCFSSSHHSVASHEWLVGNCKKIFIQLKRFDSRHRFRFSNSTQIFFKESYTWIQQKMILCSSCVNLKQIGVVCFRVAENRPLRTLSFRQQCNRFRSSNSTQHRFLPKNPIFEFSKR